MKVTRVLCDRCEDELPEQRAEREGLELELRYDPRGRDPSLLERLTPFGTSRKVDLCPTCRDAFADWLGESGERLPGLVEPPAEEPDGAEAVDDAHEAEHADA